MNKQRKVLSVKKNSSFGEERGVYVEKNKCGTSEVFLSSSEGRYFHFL